MKMATRQSSSIKEMCGFGMGCLLGGMAGVLTGLLCRSEWAIISSYSIGFAGGGFLGALIVKRLTKGNGATTLDDED